MFFFWYRTSSLLIHFFQLFFHSIEKKKNTLIYLPKYLREKQKKIQTLRLLHKTILNCSIMFWDSG